MIRGWWLSFWVVVVVRALSFGGCRVVSGAVLVLVFGVLCSGLKVLIVCSMGLVVVGPKLLEMMLVVWNVLLWVVGEMNGQRVFGLGY